MKPAPERSIEPGPLRNWLESQDFYELCQMYRHSQEWRPVPGALTVTEAFERLKDEISNHVDDLLRRRNEPA